MTTNDALQHAFGSLVTVFQPLVRLTPAGIVGYEALTRGPAGSPLEPPDALFAAARATGRIAELDRACRVSALRTAVDAGLGAPAKLFINMEPETLGQDTEQDVAELLALLAGSDLEIVLEITERALTTRPADLLTAVAKYRAVGWRIALDDVGADPNSLALMPFLAPDVIKLDLRLVQSRTTLQTAEIVSAVNAQAERSGAVVLAEGIETAEQAELALAMGAQLGQGWLFGRPAALPADPTSSCRQLDLPLVVPAMAAATPWELVRDRLPVRRSTKPLLLAMSKHIEHQALVGGGAAVVLGTFQQDRYFTPATARRYTSLAASACFVAAFAEGIAQEPARGVRGSSFPGDDPLAAEWDLAVIGPHFAAALVARDLGDSGAEHDRSFDYTLTYDRDVAVAVATALMTRVTPLRGEDSIPAPVPVEPARASDPTGRPPLDAVSPLMPATSPAVTTSALSRLLGRAVDASTAGITVAEAGGGDQALIYVNEAFEQLSGYRSAEVVGRNCRFMQGPLTDRAAVQAMSVQLRSGQEVRTTIVNYRRSGVAWWNDLVISPVRDGLGTVTHFIGIQTDVSDRVRAEERVTFLATHDPLTGLANRSAMEHKLEVELNRAHRSGAAVALLYLDLDGFKRVNDDFGHAVGDRMLVQVAQRFRRELRPGDVLARHGGDEFAVLLTGLLTRDHAHVARVAAEIGARLLTSLADPVVLDGQSMRIGASIGMAQFPYDAQTSSRLFACADKSMYVAKAGGGQRYAAAIL